MKTINISDLMKQIIEGGQWKMTSAEIDNIRTTLSLSLEGKLVIDPEDLGELTGYACPGEELYFDDCDVKTRGKDHTHRLKYIKSSIEPIEKDSFEKFVRDFVSEHRRIDAGLDREMTEIKYYERAKKLLGDK